MRNVSIASFWNVVIIVVQFTLSPIISRLYGPDEYGVYVVLNSIVINVTFFSSLRYTDAIVLSTPGSQRNNTLSISLLLIGFFVLVSLISILLFKDWLGDFLDLPKGSSLIFFIPVGILLGALIEVMLNLNVALKKFNANGMSGFLNGALARLFNIFYALRIHASPGGLISGDLFGKTAAVGSLIVSLKLRINNIGNFVRSVSIRKMTYVMYHFRSFPMYFLPANFLNNFSVHLPLYVFQSEFGSAVVGAYALAGSMLEIFNRLVPYTISTVFLQKAVELKNISHQHLSERTYKLFLYMLMLALFIFSGFALLGDVVFPWVFGEHWETAGIFTTILAFSYTFNFVAVALAEVYKVTGRQKLLLTISITVAVIKVVALAIIFLVKVNVIMALFVYGISSAIGSIIQIVGVFYVLRYHVWKVLALLVAALAVLSMVWIVGTMF